MDALQDGLRYPRWADEPIILDLRLIDRGTGGHTIAITECIPAAEAGIDDVWEYL